MLSEKVFKMSQVRKNDHYENFFKSKQYGEDYLRKYVRNHYMTAMIWSFISNHQKLTENFMRDHKETLNWFEICASQELSESFMIEMQNYINFKRISKFQRFSIEFMVKFESKLDFEVISEFYVLDENVMRIFKHKLNWFYLCNKDYMSIEFIDEMVQEGLIKPEHFELLQENPQINQDELTIYLSM